MDVSELDPRERERRYMAKGRVLTIAHDQGILNTVTDSYQQEPFPDLEQTIRVAESMGLVVNISIEPVSE